MPVSSLLSRVPYPSSVTRKLVGIATVATQAGIGVTGSVVRVTDSGLACPTWPQCQPGAMMPYEHPEYPMLNQWIEFGNRLLTIVVILVAAAALLTALRMFLAHPERKRPVFLAMAIVLGTAAQGGIGALTVMSELVWWMVATHFLVSTVLVWVAVLLLHAYNEGDDPPRFHLGDKARIPGMALVIMVGGVLVSGTVLTGAGPHAGDPDTERLDAPIGVLVTVHAGFLAGFLLLLAWLGVLAVRRRSRARFNRRYAVVWVLASAQASLGVVQHQLGVPEPLVSMHVLGSFAVLVATAALWCASRDRGPAPQPPSQPPSQDPTTDANRAGTPEPA